MVALGQGGPRGGVHKGPVAPQWPPRPDGQQRRRLVVHLEGQRERRVPGQPEPAHLAVPAQRPGRTHRVVVETPGHRHPAHRLGQLAGRPPRRRAPPAPPRPPRPRGRRPAAPGSARSRRPRAARPPPAGRRARPRRARCGRPGRAPRRWPAPAPRRRAQQLGVEGGPGGVDPGVQPVEPPGGPAQVEADRRRAPPRPRWRWWHGRKATGAPCGPPAADTGPRRPGVRRRDRGRRAGIHGAAPAGPTASGGLGAVRRPRRRPAAAPRSPRRGDDAAATAPVASPGARPPRPRRPVRARPAPSGVRSGPFGVRSGSVSRGGSRGGPAGRPLVRRDRRGALGHRLVHRQNLRADGDQSKRCTCRLPRACSPPAAPGRRAASPPPPRARPASSLANSSPAVPPSSTCRKASRSLATTGHRGHRLDQDDAEGLAAGVGRDVEVDAAQQARLVLVADHAEELHPVAHARAASARPPRRRRGRPPAAAARAARRGSRGSALIRTGGPCGARRSGRGSRSCRLPGAPCHSGRGSAPAKKPTSTPLGMTTASPPMCSTRMRRAYSLTAIRALIFSSAGRSTARRRSSPGTAGWRCGRSPRSAPARPSRPADRGRARRARGRAPRRSRRRAASAAPGRPTGAERDPGHRAVVRDRTARPGGDHVRRQRGLVVGRRQHGHLVAERRAGPRRGRGRGSAPRRGRPRSTGTRCRSSRNDLRSRMAGRVPGAPAVRDGRPGRARFQVGKSSAACASPGGARRSPGRRRRRSAGSSRSVARCRPRGLDRRVER